MTREFNLPQLRATFARALKSPIGATIRVEHERDSKELWVLVDLTRDGVSSWLLKVTGERGQCYFDCGGHGVADLDVEALVRIVAACFRQADRLALS